MKKTMTDINQLLGDAKANVQDLLDEQREHALDKRAGELLLFLTREQFSMRTKSVYLELLAIKSIQFNNQYLSMRCDMEHLLEKAHRYDLDWDERSAELLIQGS